MASPPGCGKGSWWVVYTSSFLAPVTPPPKLGRGGASSRRPCPSLPHPAPPWFWACCGMRQVEGRGWVFLPESGPLGPTHRRPQFHPWQRISSRKGQAGGAGKDLSLPV